MSTESVLRTFILENYLFTTDESELRNEDSFLDLGVIDSTGIMELVLFIEDQFGLQVRDDELLPENLDSINKIAKFIASKKNV